MSSLQISQGESAELHLNRKAEVHNLSETFSCFCHGAHIETRCIICKYTAKKIANHFKRQKIAFMSLKTLISDHSEKNGPFKLTADSRIRAAANRFAAIRPVAVRTEIRTQTPRRDFALDESHAGREMSTGGGTRQLSSCCESAE